MKLYAVLLGGSSGPDRLAEDHETVFVVAEDERAAKRAAKDKWSGIGRAHVDALNELDSVDGFDITLRKGAEGSSGTFVSYNDDPYDEAG
jgi:hypothetical protein